MGKQIKVFKICGAVVFADNIVDDDTSTIQIGTLNNEYKYGMLYDGMMWASKDAKEWVLALEYGVDFKA